MRPAPLTASDHGLSQRRIEATPEALHDEVFQELYGDGDELQEPRRAVRP
jgi:hypothetical protein